MKKISILCAALAMAALSFTSCQKEESYTANQQFIASFEQTGNDKVTVDEDLQMYWSNIEINSMLGVFAPGFSFEEIDGYINYCTTYYPTDISPDGKTAVLEHAPYYPPFPTGQQGPFYAVSDAVMWESSHINDDGSFHIGGIIPATDFMPMVARADNYGALKFKHLFGMMKVYVNLPEDLNIVYVSIEPSYRYPSLFHLNGCDVSWDANGEISLSNIDNSINDEEFRLRQGNGFYFISACPGDWRDLTFTVYGTTQNQQDRWYAKWMDSDASIHVERAGITTITLNFTENDLVGW